MGRSLFIVKMFTSTVSLLTFFYFNFVFIFFSSPYHIIDIHTQKRGARGESKKVKQRSSPGIKYLFQWGLKWKHIMCLGFFFLCVCLPPEKCKMWPFSCSNWSKFIIMLLGFCLHPVSWWTEPEGSQIRRIFQNSTFICMKTRRSLWNNCLSQAGSL